MASDYQVKVKYFYNSGTVFTTCEANKSMLNVRKIVEACLLLDACLLSLLFVVLSSSLESKFNPEDGGSMFL